MAEFLEKSIKTNFLFPGLEIKALRSGNYQTFEFQCYPDVNVISKTSCWVNSFRYKNGKVVKVFGKQLPNSCYQCIRNLRIR